MNLPPKFTSVQSTQEGMRAIDDTTATMPFGDPPGCIEAITIIATDPENDAVTYDTPVPLESWMQWDGSINTLNVVPPTSAQGKTFYVKFWVTTASGGTDSFIGVITVGNQTCLAPHGSTPYVESTAASLSVDGPNPTNGRFALTAPSVPGASALLRVFDVSGRQVAFVRGKSGTQLVWSGRDRRGIAAAPGIYVYLLEVGSFAKQGTIVVLR